MIEKQNEIIIKNLKEEIVSLKQLSEEIAYNK